jgi:hypothetical protein
MMMFQTLARVMLDGADTLKIECGACRRCVEWPRARAFERLGSDATPRDVHVRLRCSACGASRRARAWV